MAENKLLKLAEKKQWKKISKLAGSKNIETVCQAAEACGTGRSEEPYNILVNLLNSKEDSVKLAAIQGLGALRYDISSQMTRLHWLAERIPDDKEELKKAVSESLLTLKEAKK
ncbi:MAG: hypothetical protein GXY20_05280 [Clostridiales bacterium]|jgi:HEAT repeat protein|nr:hypothetical protein [Clostridiales bacterium]